MKREQRIVAAGAGSGVICMVLGIWALTRILPVPGIADDISARLAYALGANVFAMLPLFIMFATVGNSRFFSDAIDPMLHKENRAQEINSRASSNTLEQNFFFAIASLALATVVPLTYLQVVWACAIVFVVARFVFWFGYRIDPLYRAPGFAATAYLNVGIILYCLYQLL